MRLEWLDDILAVLETGSLSRAAEQRLLTQPAFSRRIRSIEAYIGVDLVDRSRKPAQLKKAVRDMQPRLRMLAAELRELVHDLKRLDRETSNRIVIASQHAITTSIAPDLVKRLSTDHDIAIRLRSANRDDCYALLMTRQADLTLLYQSGVVGLPSDDHLVEHCTLGTERLAPVFATAELALLDQALARGELPVVAYPADVFLGEVANREVFPSIGDTLVLRKKAETALTLAGLQLAMAGIGVAWLPLSLAAPYLASGVLTDLSASLPACTLSIVALRLNGPKSAIEERVWAATQAIGAPRAAGLATV